MSAGQRGLGNFDCRSFDLDLEVNVALVNADLVDELSGPFLEDKDLAVSSEVGLETWRKRPTYKRIAEYATEVIPQSL